MADEEPGLRQQLSAEDRRRIYEEEKVRIEGERGASGSALRWGCLAIGVLLLVVLGVGVMTSRRAGVVSAPAGVGSPEQDSVIFSKRAANVRSGPGLNYPIVRKTGADEGLSFSEIRGEWYRIDSFVGREEWIHSSTVLSAAEKASRSSADLRLGQWSWSETYGFAIAEGEVTNVSAVPLEHVVAVVTFLAADGSFITSDDAGIEYTPLLPGQTSPWKVHAQWNPAMKKARVEFKLMFGRKLVAFAE